MHHVYPTATGPDTQRHDPQVVAERGLHSSRYAALRHVSCDCCDGVLVLRGCVPSYYLKQIAQELVSHEVKGMSRLVNRIQVVWRVPIRHPH
jgi:hypothetical protein